MRFDDFDNEFKLFDQTRFLDYFTVAFDSLFTKKMKKHDRQDKIARARIVAEGLLLTLDEYGRFENDLTTENRLHWAEDVTGYFSDVVGEALNKALSDMDYSPETDFNVGHALWGAYMMWKHKCRVKNWEFNGIPTDDL